MGQGAWLHSRNGTHLPFLLPAAWNLDVKAGILAAILNHEDGRVGRHRLLDVL